MKKKLGTFALSTTLYASMLTGTGCFDQGYDGPFFERADVALDIPSESKRNGTTRTKGDVYNLVRFTAMDVNAWVGGVVEISSLVFEFLNRHPETSREGDWKVYGPFDDDDDNKDLSWLAKIQGNGDNPAFKFFVGKGGETDEANFDLFIEGELEVIDRDRQGTMSIHFDTVEKHPDMKDPGDSKKTFAGSIGISFERNVDTEAKNITVDFQDFSVMREGFLDDDSFFSDETYEYERREDGSGDFFLALYGEWDDTGWSGSEMERMQLDATWNSEGAGRTRGTIEEVEGSGDLLHGNLRIDECFDPDGELVWREINEAYAQLNPAYNFGDATACVFEGSVFDG